MWALFAHGRDPRDADPHGIVRQCGKLGSQPFDRRFRGAHARQDRSCGRRPARGRGLHPGRATTQPPVVRWRISRNSLKAEGEGLARLAQASRPNGCLRHVPLPAALPPLRRVSRPACSGSFTGPRSTVWPSTNNRRLGLLAPAPISIRRRMSATGRTPSRPPNFRRPASPRPPPWLKPANSINGMKST